jgi:hypothetical protein
MATILLAAYLSEIFQNLFSVQFFFLIFPCIEKIEQSLSSPRTHSDVENAVPRLSSEASTISHLLFLSLSLSFSLAHHILTHVLSRMQRRFKAVCLQWKQQCSLPECGTRQCLSLSKGAKKSHMSDRLLLSFCENEKKFLFR